MRADSPVAALCTDLYQLTMAAGYYVSGMLAPATFELFTRTLPPNRSFLVSAGLEQALAYLEGLRFTADDVDYLRRVPALQSVPAAFFDDYLPNFRFTGDVWAVEEGTPLFPPEPLLRVTAPLPEAQLVETALLAILGFQTSVASRAARMVEAAAGRPVVEFGSRRAHGTEAGILAARAAFLGGCAATSNVEAGCRFDIPVSGTMAHSWVMAFSDELTAFRTYYDLFGPSAVLLLDTYDTLAAARLVAASGMKPRAVRLDSGDVIALSNAVRAIFDDAGLSETGIILSGDLDEWRIAEIVAAGAPVAGFGVGNALSTASDAPALGAVYKLVEIQRGGKMAPIMKHSPGKQTQPGSKQVWRRYRDGVAVDDLIALGAEPAGDSCVPLLAPVMRGGRRIVPHRDLAERRAAALEAVAALPAQVRRLRDSAAYPVRFSEALRGTIERLSLAEEQRR